MYVCVVVNCSCRKIFSGEAEGKNGFTGRVLSSIQGLMKLCNHPSLVKSQAQMLQVRVLQACASVCTYTYACSQRCPASTQCSSAC